MAGETLDKALKDRLLDALMDVPGSEDRAGRTALLDGIPANVKGGLNRTDNQFVDLTNILNQLDRLGRLDNGERPVVIVVHNAWRMTRGTELGRELERIEALVEAAYGQEPPLEELPDEPEALVFGGTGEWVETSFMEQALEACRRVARLLVPRISAAKVVANVGGLGTGWLVAPRLLLTNHHVVAARGPKEMQPSAADFKLQGEKLVAWFDYHREGHPYAAVAASELVANDRELDYALLRLQDAPSLANRRQMAVTPETPALTTGVRLNIVQCPDGGPLRYAIRNNFYVGAGQKPHQVRYLTDTKEGSSGSPVLGDTWQVVAMHRGAKKVNPAVYKGEAGDAGLVKYHNEGIAIHAILEHLPAAAREEIRKAQGWA